MTAWSLHIEREEEARTLEGCVRP